MAQKIIAYVTGDHGDGFVQECGRYDDIEEIEIHTELFAPGVVISFEREQLDKPV